MALVPADPADGPTNGLVDALLTDMYQLTMAHVYYKSGRAEDPAVFDLFFRKSPFGGEFCIFAGLEEAIRFVQSFRFTPAHIRYLRTVMDCEEGFWAYLASLDASAVRIFAMAEGTVVFPREPLMRVEGPLAVCQLLETTLLNLCNYASLVATNAARFRLAAGRGKTLMEFGLRRAQGPDGGMSASRYAYMGGFDSTSNVAAARAYGITPVGTHAHSLVSAFVSLDDLPTRLLDGVDVVEEALRYRAELGYDIASSGELAAFIAYAQSFPDKFLALVDTYDSLSSGVPNFICVALALVKLGYTPLGIRCDSGDLSFISRMARQMLRAADARYGTALAACTIVASNDINEDVLLSLNDQGHEIDSFGIGTNLVTCQRQPALGMVYKLVEVNGVPRIKLSNEPSKVTIPGCKEVFRLVGGEGVPLLDILIRAGEARPAPGRRMLCRHPFDETKRVYVTPTAVIPLLRLVWKGAAAPVEGELLAGEEAVMTAPGTPPLARRRGSAHIPPAAAGPVALGTTTATDGAAVPDGPSIAAALPAGVNLRAPFPSLVELRDFVRAQLELIRADHLRPLNPTPYKISVSMELWAYLHEAFYKAQPIPELK